MKINKTSIWDQFYCFPKGDHWYSTNTNICEYARGVLRGILAALAFIVGGVLVGLFILYPYFVMIMAAITGYYEPELNGRTDGAFFWLSLFIQALLVCMVLFAVIHDALIPYRTSKAEHRRANPKPPSFLKLWYRSVKEKTCFIIERE